MVANPDAFGRPVMSHFEKINRPHGCFLTRPENHARRHSTSTGLDLFLVTKFPSVRFILSRGQYKFHLYLITAIRLQKT